VKTLLGFIAAFVLLTVAGCGHSYPPSLRLADSLMNSRPDSALALLDAVREQTAGAPEAVRMRYQLLRHQAMNKAYIPFTSDSAMLAVAAYYDRHGTANDRLLAHYLLGCVYRDLGEAPKALSAYHDAVDCADTTAVECDFVLLCKIRGQIANLLLDMQLPYEALEELRDASITAHRSGDSLMVIHCKTLQTHGFYLAGQLDSVIVLSEQQSEAFLQHGDTIYSLVSLKPALCSYIEMGRLTEAQEAMKRFGFS
jgi:tetratricopeptide (TPR) repeat protein